jgi:hypothetical protein
MDGSDAKVIVASNGGSDLLYVPSGSADVVHSLLDILSGLDYVGGIFVDDRFCTASCAGALPLSAIGLVGDSQVPRPAIVVAFKTFNQVPGNLLSAVQVSDTTLQEGQGNHGGFERGLTFNNMAAIGPDFKAGFADDLPVGNTDLAPTCLLPEGYAEECFRSPLSAALRARAKEPRRFPPRRLRAA